MRKGTLLIGLLVALAAAAQPVAAEASSGGKRVWEVNGIRLEPGEVDRLASDIARQTVVAVKRVQGVDLHGDQARRLEAIYRDVALHVYDAAVAVVGRDDLSDDAKEAQVKDLVLKGQQRSTVRVRQVLDAHQYEAYRAWEKRQVDAFRRRGLWSGGRRSRRGRRR